MISEVANALWVLIIALIGVIYYLVMIGNKKMVHSNVFEDAKFDNIFISRNENLNTSNNNNYRRLVTALNQDGTELFQRLSNKVYVSAMEIFGIQFLNSIITAVILIIVIIFLFWFEPLGFWVSGVFLFGILVHSLLTYLTIRHAINNSIRILIEAGGDENPKETAFRYGWIAASIQAIGIFSIYTIVWFIFFLIFKRLYLAEDHSIEQLTGWTVIMISFSFGIAVSSVYYREAGSQTGKGILIGADIVGGFNSKQQKDAVLYQNLQASSIIGSVYMNSISSMQDFLTVFSLILTVSMTVIGHSEKLNKQNYSGMYIPLMVITLSIISSMIFSGMSGNSALEEQSAKTYAGINQRHQIYMILFFNAIAFLLIPLMLLPTWFDIGAEEIWADKGISKWHIYLILVIGLCLQFLLVLWVEICTSMDLERTNSVALNLQSNVAFAVISSAVQTSIIQWIVMIVIAALVLTVFLLAGFFGIAVLAISLIASPLLFVGLTMAANGYSDAYRYARVTVAYSVITNVLKELTQAGSITSVYSHHLNGVAGFLANFMALGVYLIVSQATQFNFWGPYGLFGFFLGISLAYFLKTSATHAIKRCADDTFVDQTYSRTGGKGTLDRINQFLFERYRLVVLRVIVSLAACILSVLIIGTLFGTETMVTFLFGLNFLGFYFILVATIQGNCEKNARLAFQKIVQFDEGRDETREFSNQKQLDMIGTAVNQAPASHLIVFITVTSLFAILTALVISEWGFLRKWIDELMEENAGKDKPDD